MGALKILQNQFEQRSVEFPNMRGVWIQWKPISEATHSPIVIISGGNIIDAWCSYGSGGFRYDSGLDMCHLLFKPEKSTWDTDIVRGLFKTLAQKTWVELRKMKTETARRGLSKAGNLSDPVEQWLIAVHEILGSKKRACDHQESNVIWEQGNSRIVWSPERDTTKPVCRILDCVFLDSALACSMLLEQPQAKVSFAEFVQRLHPNKIEVVGSPGISAEKARAKCGTDITAEKEGGITTALKNFGKHPAGVKQKPQLELTAQQKNIVRAIGKETLMGEAVALRLKRKLGGSIKGDLAWLRRNDVLGNRGEGYFVMSYYCLLDNPPERPD